MTPPTIGGEAARVGPEDRLIQAIKAGDVARVRSLVDGDPGLAAARDEEGLSGVVHARYRDHLEILEVLLAAGPALDQFEAAAVGDVGRLTELVEADPPLVDSWSPDGFTPLHLAVFFGHAGAARLLLEHGADTVAGSRNPMEVQPLHSAVAGRHAEASRVLIEHGADVNARTHGGLTPLLEAAANGDEELVDVLLASGADPSLTGDDGKDAAEVALAKGHEALAASLRAAGRPGDGGRSR